MHLNFNQNKNSLHGHKHNLSQVLHTDLRKPRQCHISRLKLQSFCWTPLQTWSKGGRRAQTSLLTQWFPWEADLWPEHGVYAQVCTFTEYTTSPQPSHAGARSFLVALVLSTSIQKHLLGIPITCCVSTTILWSTVSPFTNPKHEEVAKY